MDLCCGIGTNTVYLAKKGFETTGMDISATAVKLAKAKSGQEHETVNFGLHSFVWLPFRERTFALIFDMGCFHHVEPADREHFISGVYRVLKTDGVYMLTCFSYRNGRAWNHFTKKQLQKYFSDRFNLKIIRHYPSVEGDGYTRFFYTVLMQKKN